jgi:hypothetical protein
MHRLSRLFDPSRRAQGSTIRLVLLSHRLTGSHLTEHQLLACSVFDALRPVSTTLRRIPSSRCGIAPRKHGPRVVDPRVSLSMCSPVAAGKRPSQGEEGVRRPMVSRPRLWNDLTTASRTPRGNALGQGLRKYTASTIIGQVLAQSQFRRRPVSSDRPRDPVQEPRKYNASTRRSQVRLRSPTNRIPMVQIAPGPLSKNSGSIAHRP